MARKVIPLITAEFSVRRKSRLTLASTVDLTVPGGQRLLKEGDRSDQFVLDLVKLATRLHVTKRTHQGCGYPTNEGTSFLVGKLQNTSSLQWSSQNRRQPPPPAETESGEILTVPCDMVRKPFLTEHFLFCHTFLILEENRGR